jgi:transposase InsO family protein
LNSQTRNCISSDTYGTPRKPRKMQIFNKFRHTKGFISLYEYMLRFRRMNTAEVERRVKILAFWEKYGVEATTEAYSVSRRTLYRWQAELRKSGGKIDSLSPKSRVPKNKRKRQIPKEVEDVILQERSRFCIGKEKIQRTLSKKGFFVGASTIGRYINDLKKSGKISSNAKLSLYGKTGRLIEQKRTKIKKIRRPKGKECIEIDTVVRFVDGIKRYVVTAVDTKSRFAFAYAYPNHSSRMAKDFLLKLNQFVDIESIQTDNGSEFAGEFEMECRKMGFAHFHIYPRCPKMNGCVERFNRTLHEEFIRFNRHLLRDDLSGFNEKLMDYLVWYNGERPHWSLNFKTPMEYIISNLNKEECHMWWTDTAT